MKSKNTLGWIIICTVITGLLWRCGSAEPDSSTNDQGGEEIVLETISQKQLPAQIDSIWVVPLETTDSSLIGSIIQMEIMDDRFYLLNSDYASVLIFDRQGRFIHGIHDQGKGPKEYIRIGDMKLDRANKRIVLSDQFSKRLLIYNRDGRFLKTIPLEMCWAPVVPFMQDQYLHVNDGREDVVPKDSRTWNLTLLDSTGRIGQQMLQDRTPNKIDFSTGRNVACLENGEVLFTPILSSVIYQINQDSITPRYRFVNKLSENKEISEADKQQISHSFTDQKSMWIDYETKGYLCSPGWFLNSDELLFAVFGQFAYKYHLFYNKRTRQVQIFDCQVPALVDLTKISDDESLRQVFASMPLCIENEAIYIEFDQIKKLFLDGRDIDPRFKALSAALGEEDNPLLVGYTLKTNNVTQ